MKNPMFISAARLIGFGWMILTSAQSAIRAESIRAASAGGEVIRIGKDGRHFVRSVSKTEFRPWGFNYDHDASNRLLEDYWSSEW